jgi:hypothetical protein
MRAGNGDKAIDRLFVFVGVALDMIVFGLDAKIGGRRVEDVQSGQLCQGNVTRHGFLR